MGHAPRPVIVFMAQGHGFGVDEHEATGLPRYVERRLTGQPASQPS